MLSNALTVLIGDAEVQPALPVELFKVAELEESSQERLDRIVLQQSDWILSFYLHIDHLYSVLAQFNLWMTKRVT